MYLFYLVSCIHVYFVQGCNRDHILIELGEFFIWKDLRTSDCDGRGRQERVEV